MSFQRSSALESQPTTWRREDDASYADDPEFRDFASKISDDLFALTRNVARLSQEVAKLGTKHETARVRERVKSTVEETSDKFKEIGEGVKKITTWPDVGVCFAQLRAYRRTELNQHQANKPSSPHKNSPSRSSSASSKHPLRSSSNFKNKP